MSKLLMRGLTRVLGLVGDELPGDTWEGADPPAALPRPPAEAPHDGEPTAERRELQAARARVERLSGEAEELTMALSVARAETDEVSRQLREARGQAEQARVRVVQHAEDEAAATEQTSAVRTALETARAERRAADERASSAREQLAASSEELGAVRAEAESHAEWLAKAREEVGRSREELGRTRAELEVAQTELATRASELDAARQELDALRSGQRQSESGDREVRAQLSLRIDELEAGAHHLEVQLDRARRDADVARRRAETGEGVTAELTELRAARDDADDRVLALERTQRGTERDNMALAARLAELEQELNDARRRVIEAEVRFRVQLAEADDRQRTAIRAAEELHSKRLAHEEERRGRQDLELLALRGRLDAADADRSEQARRANSAEASARRVRDLEAELARLHALWADADAPRAAAGDDDDLAALQDKLRRERIVGLDLRREMAELEAKQQASVELERALAEANGRVDRERAAGLATRAQESEQRRSLEVELAAERERGKALALRADGSVAAAAEAQRAWSTRIGALERERDEAMQVASTRATELREATARAEGKNRAAEQAQAALMAARAETLASQTQLATLSLRIEELASALEASQSLLAQATARHEQLAAEHARVVQELGRLQAERGPLASARALVQAELEQLRGERSSLLAERDRLAARHAVEAAGRESGTTPALDELQRRAERAIAQSRHLESVARSSEAQALEADSRADALRRQVLEQAEQVAAQDLLLRERDRQLDELRSRLLRLPATARPVRAGTSPATEPPAAALASPPPREPARPAASRPPTSPEPARTAVPRPPPGWDRAAPATPNRPPASAAPMQAGFDASTGVFSARNRPEDEGDAGLFSRFRRKK